MEVGTGMMYPVSVVDGLVHQLGGWKLETECTILRTVATAKASTTNLKSTLSTITNNNINDNNNDNINSSSSSSVEPCPVGTAIRTTHGCNELLKHYNTIIHTTPPFYKYDKNPIEMLLNCYRNSYQLSFLDNNNTLSIGSSSSQTNQQQQRVAVPLLGSCARGFPYDISIDVAATAATEWMQMMQPLTTTNNTATATTTTSSSSHGNHDDDIPTNNTKLSSSSSNSTSNISSSSSSSSNHHQSIIFGLLEESIAKQLCDAIEEKIQHQSNKIIPTR
jgi:Macro domain